MHPVLKRIAVNGLITAVALGLLGLGFAELASLWLAGSAPDRGVPAPAAPTTEPVNELLRYRVPLMMAGWGFLFVAASELVLFLVRGNRPAPPAKKRDALRPDTAEVLLDELLRQAEAAQAKPAPTPDAPPGRPAQSPEARP